MESGSTRSGRSEYAADRRAWQTVADRRPPPEMEERGLRDGVYPKMKVRVDGEKITYQKETTVLLMKVVESLSLESSRSSDTSVTGKLYPDSRTYLKSQPDVRATQPLLLHKSTTSGSLISGEKGKSNIRSEADDICTKNGEKPIRIRASSAPRPRAALSSRENDDMIGLMNKRSRERYPVQGNQNNRQGVTSDRKSNSTSRIRMPAIRSRSSAEGPSDSLPKVKQSPQIKLMARQRSPARKGWVF